jgi:D-alanyl-D-alanine carboxypeptidase/D-alanyl-D-alanine-endopeptidase (penicillin-binding protein 4)
MYHASNLQTDPGLAGFPIFANVNAARIILIRRLAGMACLCAGLAAAAPAFAKPSAPAAKSAPAPVPAPKAPLVRAAVFPVNPAGEKPAVNAAPKTAPAGAKPAGDKSAFYFPSEALIGWAVRDAAGDSLLESHQGERNFTPGSTQKLFTTWIALDLLGGDKTYATELFRTGSIEGETLKGDLVIRGGGDPSFAGGQFGPERGAEAVFAQWAQAVRKLGVRRVEGCVIGDGTYLEEDGPHPAILWEDAGNYYAGTAAGLSFNDNLYQASFSGAAAVGKPVAFQGTLPVHSGIARFDNRVLTGPSDGRDSAFILGGFPAPYRNLRGTYPAGRMAFAIKGSLPNPAWTCAREFRDYLIGKGIAFGPDASSCGDSLALPNHAPVPGGIAVPGARQVSPPLRELIRIVNQKSDNNYAAQTLALLGKGTGRSADWRGGLAAVNEYLARNGFDPSRIHLKDGNGLSRYNWIAPTQTARLLTLAYHGKNFAAFQAALLGSPGSAGKLDRFGEGWEGRLWAKTGTLEGVSALAGYLQARSGRMIAFAIAANNFEPRNGDAQKYFAPMLKAWAAKY